MKNYFWLLNKLGIIRFYQSLQLKVWYRCLFGQSPESEDTFTFNNFVKPVFEYKCFCRRHCQAAFPPQNRGGFDKHRGCANDCLLLPRRQATYSWLVPQHAPPPLASSLHAFIISYDVYVTTSSPISVDNILSHEKRIRIFNDTCNRGAYLRW